MSAWSGALNLALTDPIPYLVIDLRLQLSAYTQSSRHALHAVSSLLAVFGLPSIHAITCCLFPRSLWSGSKLQDDTTTLMCHFGCGTMQDLKVNKRGLQHRGLRKTRSVNARVSYTDPFVANPIFRKPREPQTDPEGRGCEALKFPAKAVTCPITNALCPRAQGSSVEATGTSMPGVTEKTRDRLLSVIAERAVTHRLHLGGGPGTNKRCGRWERLGKGTLFPVRAEPTNIGNSWLGK